MAVRRRSIAKTLFPILALGLLILAVPAFFLTATQVDAVRMHEQDRALALRERIRVLESAETMVDRPIAEERIVHVTVGDEGYEKPVSAREGGFDVEATVADAAARLVERMLVESRTLAFDADINRPNVPLRPLDAASNRDAELAARLAGLLRRRSIPAVRDLDRKRLGSAFLVSDRELSDFGRVVEVREAGGRGTWSVLIDPDMRRAELPLPQAQDAFRVGFRTDLQTEAGYARDDAAESLHRRLGDEIWRLAVARFGLDADEEGRFRMILERRFPPTLLVDLGRQEFGIVRKVLEGPEGDAIFYQADVSWAGDRGSLRRAAENVRDVMVAESRVPIVRGGLAIGALVLAILGWLKVDWWLKGRHAFLSKTAFVILGLLGLALSLLVPLHG